MRAPQPVGSPSLQQKLFFYLSFDVRWTHAPPSDNTRHRDTCLRPLAPATGGAPALFAHHYDRKKDRGGISLCDTSHTLHLPPALIIHELHKNPSYTSSSGQSKTVGSLLVVEDQELEHESQPAEHEVKLGRREQRAANILDEADDRAGAAADGVALAEGERLALGRPAEEREANRENKIRRARGGAARTRCVPSSAVRKDGRARRTHFLAIFLMGAFFFGAAFFTTFFTGFLTTCGHVSEQDREKA